MKQLKCVAAMSLNRVIGAGNKIPWHLPEDFKWFKKLTTGHILVMGRKTFESIGKPLPNRTTFVLTRAAQLIAGVEIISDLAQIKNRLPENDQREIFICGGAQIYEQILPLCSALYLTLVKRTVDGDAFFPQFEDQFTLKDKIAETPEFEIRHYVNNSPPV
jgi:dihydrofolate reductase